GGSSGSSGSSSSASSGSGSGGGSYHSSSSSNSTSTSSDSHSSSSTSSESYSHSGSGSSNTHSRSGNTGSRSDVNTSHSSNSGSQARSGAPTVSGASLDGRGRQLDPTRTILEVDQRNVSKTKIAASVETVKPREHNRIVRFFLGKREKPVLTGKVLPPRPCTGKHCPPPPKPLSGKSVPATTTVLWTRNRLQWTGCMRCHQLWSEQLRDPAVRSRVLP